MKTRSLPAPSRATLRIALLAALAAGALFGRGEDAAERQPTGATASTTAAALPS